MLRVENVSKSFGDLKAVDQLSVSVIPGSVFGLLGPNGAGKTTLIRMLMNIIQPDSGKIYFHESQQRPQAQEIGYLPEERGLYQKISVLETLQYFGRLRRVKNLDARIDVFLERFDLASRRTSKVSELSKGNQQKLQFINTVLHDPAYIVLDEPFSGLDPVNQIELKNILAELKAAGKMIIFSSHQMDQVEKICDDAALVDKGVLITAGSLEHLKQKHCDKQIVVTPRDPLELEHSYFTDINAVIENGSARLPYEADTFKDTITRLNQLVDIQSLRVSDTGLEDIFIKLVKGNPT